MDESQGSSSSSPDPPPPNHAARLDSLNVTVPCKSAADALLASLSVNLSKDLNSNVLDAFLSVLQDPAFTSREVTFKGAQDISKHISEQRKRIAQARSSVRSQVSALQGTSLTKNAYGVVPQLIIDLVAQQLASEMVPIAEQVDWDTNVCNVTDVRCPREGDLLNMALVHRTWTQPVSRVLRTRAKLVGSKNLQSFLRSPRMGPWLREVYYIEGLDYEHAGEMVRLLTHLLRNTPNLRKLAIRTWWRLDMRDLYDFHNVVMELKNMQHLEALWLFPNRGHVACLPTLIKVLPHLRSLKALHVRNWMGGAPEEPVHAEHLQSLINTTSPGSQLTTLSFVDGGMNGTTALFLPWLLRDSPLTVLELHTKDICRLQETGSGLSLSPLFRAVKPFLNRVKVLRLHYSSLNDDKEARTEFLQACTSVKTLSIVVGLHHELNRFPDSIETLHVHFSTIWPVSGRALSDLLKEQESLTKLKKVKLTKDPIEFIGGLEMILQDEGERMEAAWHIDDVRELCEERHIELSNEYDFVSLDVLSRL